MVHMGIEREAAKFCDEGWRGASGGEERSDERKIVSYIGRRYAAVASFQLSTLVRSHLD